MPPIAWACPAPPSQNARKENYADIGVVSFPGGNTTILRMMLARMLPGAIGGDGSVAAIATSPINFGCSIALERRCASV